MLHFKLQKVAQLILVALLIALSYGLAVVSWQVVALFTPGAHTDNSLKSATPDLPARAVANDLSLGPLIEKVKRADLFGRQEVTASPPKVVSAPPKQAPKTRLNLKVQGVVINPGGVSAAILLHNGQQRAYLEGETLDLPGNIRLQSVLHDRIYLERNGVVETLPLEKQQAEAGSFLTPREDAAASVDLSSEAITTLVGNPRETLLSQPLSLMRYLSLMPYHENGQLVGFQVMPGQDQRLFQHLPFKAGDVITAINGLEAQPHNLSQLYELLRQDNTFTLDVLRQGEPLQLTLHL